MLPVWVMVAIPLALLHCHEGRSTSGRAGNLVEIAKAIRSSATSGPSSFEYRLEMEA